MVVDTPAGLKAKMPIAQVAGTSVSDLHDLIDTLEDRTTQDLITTATNYGVALADNRRKVVVTAAAAVTITLPSNTPVGFELLIIQAGTGAGVVAATGGAVRSRDNHTRTAGQYAVAYLVCYANAGTAPQVMLTGDTAP
jgi:hypothetical protein